MNKPERVVFRFPRLDYVSPVPIRREWERKNNKELQAIERYVDPVKDEIVLVYEVIDPEPPSQPQGSS